MKDKKYTKLLESPLKNIIESPIQDGMRESADLVYRAGCKSVVIRLTNGECCEWCTSMAGIYDYPCDKEVFTRHDNCDCTVIVKTEKGIQNAHTKAKITGANLEDILDNKTKKLYDNSPTIKAKTVKALRKDYIESVNDGWLSPHVKFEQYCEIYKSLAEQVLGKKCVADVEIREISKHFMDRVGGTMKDPLIFKKKHKIVRRSGVEVEDLIEALQSGRTSKLGGGSNDNRKSITILGAKCKVSINPDTGTLIQCSPRGRK